MSTFKIIVTPEMEIDKWLSDLEIFLTPFSIIDANASNYLELFNRFLRKDNLKNIDVEQLTGPLYNRMLYQYASIIGQLQLPVTTESKERVIFLTRAKDIYITNIDWIVRTYAKACV